MKKVLALVVAFALCFTVFAGCFVTSAAEATLTVTDVTVPAEGGAFSVTVTGNLSDASKYVQLVEITFAAELTDVALVGGKAYPAEDWTYIYDETTNTIKLVDIYEAEFTCTITGNAPANTSETEVATYAINAKADFADYNTAAEIVKATAAAAVTVKAAVPAHVHAPAEGADWEKDATNHWKVCAEHADVKLEEAAHEPADAVVEDGYTIVRCSVCGYEISKVAVEPEGPIVDDTLVFAGASVGFGTSSLQVNFRIRNTVLTKYNNMELVIIPEKYDTTTFNKVDTPEEIVVPYAELSGTGTFRTYLYTDIQLYELGLTIKYMLRGTDANGNAVESPVYETSPAAYLKDLYAESTNDSNLRTLITDALIVADEAAEAFAKENSDLANAASVLEGFDIDEATPSVDSYNTVDVHNATDAAWGTESGTHKVAKSVSIGKVPYISYRIRGASNLALDKVSFTVSYTQVTGAGGATAPYNKTFTSADTANVYVSGSFLMFKFDEVGLLDGDKDLSIVATYDGAEVFNATYSIETYLGANTNDASIGDLATALMKLGASAGAYFA